MGSSCWRICRGVIYLKKKSYFLFLFFNFLDELIGLRCTRLLIWCIWKDVVHNLVIMKPWRPLLLLSFGENVYYNLSNLWSGSRISWIVFFLLGRPPPPFFSLSLTLFPISWSSFLCKSSKKMDRKKNGLFGVKET